VPIIVEILSVPLADSVMSFSPMVALKVCSTPLEVICMFVAPVVWNTHVPTPPFEAKTLESVAEDIVMLLIDSESPLVQLPPESVKVPVELVAGTDAPLK
jgi:hypothetical protein